MKDKLETHKSYMTTYRMYKDSERELRFPLAVISPTRTEDRASTARSFVATWRVALLIAQRSRSNTATGSVQASKRPIAYFGKHAGSRRRVIPSCGLPSCWSRHCWRTCGWCYGGRSSPAHGRDGRDLPRSSRSRRSVTGFVAGWKRSYAAGGRSKRTGLECQHHRQRPRADRGQPTACQLAVSDSFRQIPSKSG